MKEHDMGDTERRLVGYMTGPTMSGRIAPDRTYASLVAELAELRDTERFLFAEIERLQRAVLEEALNRRRKDVPCAHCSR